MTDPLDTSVEVVHDDVEIEESTDHDFVPDVFAVDGDVVVDACGLTMTAVHTPGHTSNHTCWSLEQERALFTGDHVMGWSTTVVSPPDGDMTAYLDSLRRVAARDDDMLWPTHGPPRDDAAAYVQALIDHRVERERGVLEAVRAGRSTIPDMVALLYADVREELHDRPGEASGRTSNGSSLRVESRSRVREPRPSMGATGWRERGHVRRSAAVSVGRYRSASRGTGIPCTVVPVDHAFPSRNLTIGERSWCHCHSTRYFDDVCRSMWGIPLTRTSEGQQTGPPHDPRPHQRGAEIVDPAPHFGRLGGTTGADTMKTHDHVTKWIRLVLAAAMAVAVGLAIQPAGGQAALEYDPSANGGAAGVGELTRFEIDGDAVPGTSSNTGVTLAPGVDADWQSTPYGPQPPTSDPTTLAPEGIGSSGLLPLVFSEVKADDFPIVSPSPNPAFGLPGEPQFCTGGKEDGWVGGEKVQKVSIDNPLFNVDGLQALECSSVLDKGNLFSAYAAYETVAVPNDYGDPDAGSQNHVIVYGAWERDEVPGELNFYIPIADAVAGNSAGDRLIAFDYDSSAPASYRILGWNGANWATLVSGTAAVNSDTFAAAVGFVDGSAFTPGSGSKPSFGEFALDLTASNILPSDNGSCVELSTAGFVFTETGNSANAQLKDYVGAPKIPISNCGPLSVTKAGPDGVTNSPDFDFRVEQQDSAVIFDTAPVTSPASTTTQYNDQFILGETVTLNDVLAQPDYVAFEEPVSISGGAPASLPTGWDMVSVDCTYIDGFASGYPIVTERLYADGSGRLLDGNGDLKVFQVHSTAFNTLTGNAGFVPNCVITNDAAGIVVAKETLPDGSTTAFPFEIVGGGVTQDVDLADGESSFFAFDAGVEVTITEGDAGGSPAWNLTDITCLNEDGSAATISGETADSVTLPVGAVGNTISCTFTNTQNGTVTVDKTGLPGDAAQEFDFTVGATPVGPLTIPGPSQSVDVAPGTYTVTELEPPVDADWVLTDITCDNEANENLTGQSVDVIVAPGQNVNCTFTNKARGPVTITKDAVLLDPAPVPGWINQFDVQYTVTAESASYVDENIVVTDAFAFPGTLAVVGGPTVSGAASTPGWDGDANTELYSGTIPAQGSLTWTIDVRVELDLASLMADRDCNAVGSGAWNDVMVAVDGVPVDEADACIPFGDPTITIDKRVVGPVTVNPDLSMSVTYSIDVANIGDGPGAYDLADTFGFPGWVAVSGVSIANTAPGTIGVEDGTFNGAGNADITSATTGIGEGITHTYQITVTFTAAPTADDAGVLCGPGAGNGLFNLATVTTSTGPVSDDACIDIPRGQITVTKATFGDTGTFDFASTVPGALIDGGSITTTTDDGTVSGNTLSAYVTPGSYTVTESPQAGWTQIATPCGDADPAIVTDGGSVSCDFVNGKQAQITVQKVADPAGTFEFTLAPAPGDVQNVASGGSYTWTGLDAGDFTLTETVVSPWQLVERRVRRRRLRER